MLRAALEKEDRKEKWRDYVAQNVWAVCAVLSRPDKPFPSWMELTQEREPEPTGEDIYIELKARWGGG